MSDLILGFSPCPNDTYIFGGLVNGMVSDDFNFKVLIKDVEELNKLVLTEKINISKLSFHTYIKSFEKYVLLDSGSALGEKCGPLLIGNKKSIPSTGKIAIPGKNTTAALLLILANIGDFELISMPFDQIIPSLLNGDVDYGLVIHESRFTYQSLGLNLVFDLGEWWEDKTSLPLPLGGIVAHRSLPAELIEQIELKIKESIIYANNNPKKIEPFIASHAQELDKNVRDQHIGLYVNHYSKSLGEKGRESILKMFELAQRVGLVDKYNTNLFTK